MMFSARTNDNKNAQAEVGAPAPPEHTAVISPHRGMRQPYSGNQYRLGRAAGPVLQRKCACEGGGQPCEKCEKDKLLQRSASGAAPTTAPPAVHQVLSSPGRPLDPQTRFFMEPRFGHDFGSVRIHTDGAAAESARAVNALAYTVGTHVVFGSGRYAPQSGEGRKLLAHELAHTVQQAGMTPSFAGKLEIGEAHDSWENQADAAAERVLQGGFAPNLGGDLGGFRLQRNPGPYDNLTIDQLRRLLRTDPAAADALWARFRAMSNVELERYARTDPMAQAEYASRTIPPAAAEGQGRFSNPSVQNALEQDIALARAQHQGATGVTRQAASPVQPGIRTEGGTMGSARTDIPGLENRMIIGRSPQAGGTVNPQSQFAPPTDPATLPQTHGHAEQGIADELERLLRSVPREQLAGRRVWMLIEQEPCSTCAQGIADPAVEAGVLRRLSEAFPEVTFEIRSMGNSALVVLRAGVRVNPGPVGATAPGQGTAPTVTPVRVGTQIRVLNSAVRPDGSTVAEVEYNFGENLEGLNRGMPAGSQIPSRLLIRVTQNAEGVITSVESLSGQPQGLVEVLARQTLPEALAGELGGAEAGAGEGAAAAARGGARLMAGLRVGGWVAFALITGYQLATATPAQRPRVLVQAGGGLAGSMLGTYLVCNLALDIETVGLGLVICLFVAGGVGGYVGSQATGAVYDEATRTELDRALMELEGRSTNARILFNILVDGLGSAGESIDAGFVRRYMSIIPSDLQDYELIILAGQLGPAPLRGTVPTPAQAAMIHPRSPAIAPPPARWGTVCPNCHRSNGELRGNRFFGYGSTLTDQDRQAILNWIQSPGQAVGGSRTAASPPPPRVEPSHTPPPSRADQTHPPFQQGIPSVAAQQGTVCPNCHRETPGRVNLNSPLSNLDFAALDAQPSSQSIRDEKLEVLRAAIRQLPERQRQRTADEDVYGPQLAPVHPPHAQGQQGFPSVQEQVNAICRSGNCHQPAGAGRVRSLIQGQSTFTDRDRQVIANWIQAQPQQAPLPQGQSHSTPPGVHPSPVDLTHPPSQGIPSLAQQQGTGCPSGNCHQPSGRSQWPSLSDRVGGFGSGPGGQMTDADRRRLLEFIQATP